MHSARLSDGRIIPAKDYIPNIHGTAIFCLDSTCKVPVHFVQESEKVPFFKTSGKGASVHIQGCAFASKLTFESAVSKVSAFQQEFSEKGLEEFVVRLNTNKIDPDYVPRERGEPKEKEVAPNAIKEIKEKKEKRDSPQTLSSLASLVKLFTSVEPDLLATVKISYKGHKLPISLLITDYLSIHHRLWKGETLDIPYFIHGRIHKIIRLPRVWYFNLHDGEDFYFTLIVFEKYFKHFTYTDEELLDRPILVMGKLRKNTFKEGKQNTEMVMKSNEYIEFLD
ncbi:hypothetical protein D7X33_19200 [Butyricicoccus sp. 1XD8-22]|nr:hypothetical protein D7X33_19200 [Butyricicoccus sp. 1XD8-22]